MINNIIFDFGGGTFDATVLQKHSGGIEILGIPEGIERLGGVDFDEAILSRISPENSVNARRTYGGTAQAAVRERIREFEKKLGRK